MASPSSSPSLYAPDHRILAYAWTSETSKWDCEGGHRKAWKEKKCERVRPPLTPHRLPCSPEGSPSSMPSIFFPLEELATSRLPEPQSSFQSLPFPSNPSSKAPCSKKPQEMAIRNRNADAEEVMRAVSSILGLGEYLQSDGGSYETRGERRNAQKCSTDAEDIMREMNNNFDLLESIEPRSYSQARQENTQRSEIDDSCHRKAAKGKEMKEIYEAEIPRPRVIFTLAETQDAHEDVNKNAETSPENEILASEIVNELFKENDEKTVEETQATMEERYKIGKDSKRERESRMEVGTLEAVESEEERRATVLRGRNFSSSPGEADTAPLWRHLNLTPELTTGAPALGTSVSPPYHFEESHKGPSLMIKKGCKNKNLGRRKTTLSSKRCLPAAKNFCDFVPRTSGYNTHGFSEPAFSTSSYKGPGPSVFIEEQKV